MPSNNNSSTFILGITFIVGCACGYFYHKNLVGCTNTLSHKFEQFKKTIDKSD